MLRHPGILYFIKKIRSIIIQNPIKNQIEKNRAKDKSIKDIRNLFKPKKKEDNGIDITEYKGLGDIRHLYRIKKCYDIEFKGLRDIRTLFKLEEDYYEPERIHSDFDNNCIEYEGNGDKNKTLSVNKYLDKTRAYLSDMINDHKT